LAKSTLAIAASCGSSSAAGGGSSSSGGEPALRDERAQRALERSAHGLLELGRHVDAVERHEQQHAEPVARRSDGQQTR
jgi:hypothetical protein